MNPAKENTWRALKGETMLMTWSCRFGIHKWTVWSEENHTFANDKYLKMTRHCASCNFPHVKLVKIPQF